MVSVTVGVIITLVAWLVVLAITAHGKYVVEKIDAGEYDKGPLTNEGGDHDE